MGKGDTQHPQAAPEQAAPERIEIDESRLRALVSSTLGALRIPDGLDLFEEFPDPGPLKTRDTAVADGVYLLRGGECQVSPEASRVVFENLLACFREHLGGQSPEWDALESGMSGDREDPARFLGRILENDARFVTEKAGAWGVDPDSLSLFSLFWARPFREEAARRLLEGVDLSRWRMGFCPVCGHWPSFGYFPPEGDRRTLRCAACSTAWGFARVRCPFCLETDHESLPYLTVDDRESLPIYVCEECKRYLKHRREEKGFPREEDVDFLLTAPLDYVAVSQGYIQESLISVRFDEPDGEPGRAYRAKAHYEQGPAGAEEVH